MSQARKKPAGLVADANVLIDYAESATSILALISLHVATFHIPMPVLEEVHQLSEEDAAGLGINVVDRHWIRFWKHKPGKVRPLFRIGCVSFSPGMPIGPC